MGTQMGVFAFKTIIIDYQTDVMVSHIIKFSLFKTEEKKIFYVHFKLLLSSKAQNYFMYNLLCNVSDIRNSIKRETVFKRLSS